MADENVGLPGSAGGLFAHASAVTNEAANLVAEFRGGWTVSLEETFAEWYGQSTVRKGSTMTKLDIVISVAEVAFKPGTLSKLWNITAGSVAVKSAGTEAATSYTFDSSVLPRELQYLVSVELDGKTFQAYTPDAVINSTTFNFTNEDYVVHNVDLILYSATGSLLTLIDED